MALTGTNSSYKGNTAAGSDRNDDVQLHHNIHQQQHDVATTVTTTTTGSGIDNHRMQRLTLTAKPHPFAGAVLSPKHAQELNPSLCLAIASALAQQQQFQQQQQQQQQLQPGSHHNHHPPTAHRPRSNSGSNNAAGTGGGIATTSSATSVSMIPYTLWITEAWRVLGWAEPSAALFWEMATMYYTLVMANRASSSDWNSNNNSNYYYGFSLIPPILSCGSTSSLGSGTTMSDSGQRHLHHHYGSEKSSLSASGGGGSNSSKKYASSSSAASAKELPIWLIGTFLLLHCEEYAYERNLAGHDERRFFTATGGTSLSPLSAAGSTTASTNSSISSGGGGAEYMNQKSNPSSITSASDSNNRMDFTAMSKHTSLSPRTRLHAHWNHDNSSCIAYLLRHLRKILLFSAVSHNLDAIRACMHLAAIPPPVAPTSATVSGVSPTTTPTTATTTATTAASLSNDRTTEGSTSSSKNSKHRLNMSVGGLTSGGRGGGGGGGGYSTNKYNANELRRQHDDEHGNVGLNVHLTIDDLEHLEFVLQLPSGGGIDDPPLRIGDFLWSRIYQSHTSPPPTATIPLVDVEREIRQQLELDLVTSGFDTVEDKDDLSTDDDSTGQDLIMTRISSTGITKKRSDSNDSTSNRERAKQPNNHYHKELSYTHLRGTTILLKPNPPEIISSGASATGSLDGQNVNNYSSTSGRLHDLVISDCSDAHFYLLQPFEHATIASTTGCTIVVGAVAGLLHVVDCEKTVITSAARRILVSNSCDVQLCVFSPSPPLLVGDNRSCQLAPYNTYYDGIHDDLIATGLAAPSNAAAAGTSGAGSLNPDIPQSPRFGSKGVTNTFNHDNENTAPGGWQSLHKASNKWKHPIELSKLEVPQVPGSPSIVSSSAGVAGSTAAGGNVASPGADDKAMIKPGSGSDASMHSPIILPPADFNILFVPVETEMSRQRRLNEADEAATTASSVASGTGGSDVGSENTNPKDIHTQSATVSGSNSTVPATATAATTTTTTPSTAGAQANGGGTNSIRSESQYCRLLGEILQLSPFRLPIDYERRVLLKAERMKNIQTAVVKHLSIDQQRRFEDELNRGFRDWLVTSGNLRQVLDLVHLERRGGV